MKTIVILKMTSIDSVPAVLVMITKADVDLKSQRMHRLTSGKA